MLKDEGDTIIYQENRGYRVIERRAKEVFLRWGLDTQEYCTDKEWSEAWVAFSIIKAIEDTTQINPFWFEKYKEITGTDLLHVAAVA